MATEVYDRQKTGTKDTQSQLNIDQLLKGALTPPCSVELKGWVRSRRDSKAGLSFIALNDGSCFGSIQIVAEKSLSNYEQEIAKLTKDCAIVVKGQLVESQGKGQTVEVQASEIQVIGWVEQPDTYPVSPKRHSMEYLREHPHLRVRTNTFGAMARVRNTLAQTIHRTLNDLGYVWVNTPIITDSDCEGAGELFHVSSLDMANLPRNDKNEIDFSQDFFGREAFLTVSGQLNVESYCLALSKVYTFGPTFRAENSNTSRHLAEFWMLEPEIAFADLNDNIALAESLLNTLVETTLNERGDDIDFFNQWVDKTTRARLEALVNRPFTRIPYTEAVEILQACGQSFEFPVQWGIDLQSEHERYLCEQHVNGPVVITDYPKDIKAFYMRMNDDEKTVAAMDVLVPGVGELIGGAQREERLAQLDQRMKASSIDPIHYQWYRDLRQYGTVPHAGFGLGFERLLGYVTGVSNVRDLIPFPRTPGQMVL